MKIRLKNKATSLIAVLTVSISAYAQFPGCPNIVAGPDQTSSCSPFCTTISATPFHAGETNTYVVNQIPHTPPIAYNQAGGTPVSVGTDDVWSQTINLPFPFCFYGQTYTTCKIGSNGAIMLGPASGGGNHPWSFTANCPSPNLTPAGHIFGVYHDIDPSVAGTVRWYMLGTAPCRIFVVSYNQLGHFSCTSLRSTHMMVLYETTNVIDVYVENKATCSGWNGGRAIVGIQNTAGTQGLAAPNRNSNPSWTATTPEAWRFTPDGPPIYTVQWFDGATLLGSGNTINVCPTDTTTYTAQATYTRCDGLQIVAQDQVTINVGPPLTFTAIPTSPNSCGGNDGSILISGLQSDSLYVITINTNTDSLTADSIGEINITNLPSGTYTINVSLAGCSGTPQTIVVSDPVFVPLPTLTIVPDSVLCEGDTLTITASGQSGNNFNWTAPGSCGVISNNVLAVDNIMLSCSGQYYVTQTDSNGCTSDPAFINITVNPNPVITSCNIGAALCSGDTLLLTCNPLGGVYNILSGPGVISNDTLFTNLAGSSIIQYSLAQNGCTGTAQIGVITNQLPVLTAQPFSASCNNGDGMVVFASSGGLFPYQYSIDGVVFVYTDTVQNINSGTYIGYVVDSNGCGDTASFTINVPSPPSVDSVIVSQISCNNSCDGQITSFGTNSNGGVLSYSWNTSPAQTSPSISNLCPGTYTLTLTETYTSGGQTTVWQENFNNAANWNLAFPTGVNDNQANFWVVNANEGGVLPPGCGVANNGNNTLHITSTFNPSGGAAYNAGGLCAFNFCVSTNTMAHTNNISTVGFTNLNISFDFISNGQGLIDNLSLLYNTGSGWNVLAPSLKSSVCGNGQGQWTAFSIALPPACENIPNLQIGFNWTNNDDGIGTDPSAAIDNIVITSLSGGTQTCSINYPVTLANPTPVVLASVIDSVSCGGYSDGSITVSASGGTPGYTYSFDGGVTYGLNNVFNNLPAGSYTVFAQDNNGCTTSAQYTVHQPNPINTTTNRTNVSCFGGNNGNASVVASGGTPGFTYSWNTTPAQTTATANNLAAGTYIVTVTDANGCQKLDTVNITQPSPLSLLLNSTINRCGHTEGTASVSISGGTPGYGVLWNTAPAQTTNTAIGLTAGTYTATVIDANGCTASDSVIVNETLGITADFTASTILGDSPLFVQFNNNSTGTITTYTWDFGTGVFDSTNISPSYTFTNGGAFNVILYACYTPQCCDSASLTIEVLDSLQTYNVFTPNGDGQNDVFTVKFKDASSITMNVFNRWGEKVHEETAITPAWDGRKKGGAQCPDGTYFYIINAIRRDGKAYEHKGTVTLIR